MIPKASSFKRPGGLLVGISAATMAAPVYFILPGAEERLISQASVWGHRWRRNLSHVTPHVERALTKAEPRIQKGMDRIDPAMKRAAMGVDKNMRKFFGQNAFQRWKKQ
jgi:hypothetical protein